MRKISLCLLSLLCAVTVSCKDSTSQSSSSEAETLKAAPGAPTFKGLALVARCTKTYKTNEVAGSDCIDFYGKVYLHVARSSCNLTDNEQNAHNDQDLATVLELNQACSHEGMQGGAFSTLMAIAMNRTRKESP